MARPNILYIHSHDTGRFIQPFGRAVPTPHLQRLAEEGVFFRQAFCCAPVCSASRSALLTGLSPHASGMIGLAHRGFRLNDYRQHLAHFLSAAGYHTALCGVQHEAPQDEVDRLGYTQILPLPSGHSRDIAQAAAGFLAHPHSQPFFLSVGFHDTHREFPAPDPLGPASDPVDDPRFILPPPPLPDLPAVRQDMAGFITSARRLDEGVGIVLQALRERGLAENTLVISTTDHGPAFPGMKCNLTDFGLGVSLILRYPNGFPGGQVVDEMVSHLDIYPTICDLLELPRPAWLAPGHNAQAQKNVPGNGTSLLPLLRGEPGPLHEELFGEVTYHAAYEPQRSVRTSRWKYIRRFEARARPVLPNCDDSPSKSAWLELGWADRAPELEQLYDLAFDPNERSNLAYRLESAGILSEMRQRLSAWMAATADPLGPASDPLLQGSPVPAPHGARANDPDGLSPKDPTRIVE
jgi:arylsulfatase A-like enzyme